MEATAVSGARFEFLDIFTQTIVNMDSTISFVKLHFYAMRWEKSHRALMRPLIPMPLRANLIPSRRESFKASPRRSLNHTSKNMDVGIHHYRPTGSKRWRWSGRGRLTPIVLLIGRRRSHQSMCPCKRRALKGLGGWYHTREAQQTGGLAENHMKENQWWFSV